MILITWHIAVVFVGFNIVSVPELHSFHHFLFKFERNILFLPPKLMDKYFSCILTDHVAPILCSFTFWPKGPALVHIILKSKTYHINCTLNENFSLGILKKQHPVVVASSGISSGPAGARASETSVSVSLS